jgi:hypothetical protein
MNAHLLQIFNLAVFFAVFICPINDIVISLAASKSTIPLRAWRGRQQVKVKYALL